MYNSDMIFRKKRCFWPISTGFCISEHKKFVYVQTGCRQGQSVNTDSALKITRKIIRTGRPWPGLPSIPPQSRRRRWRKGC